MPFRFAGNMSVCLDAGSVSPVKLDSSMDKSNACEKQKTQEFNADSSRPVKAKAYNTCRAPQAATATSEALVMSQAKLA